MKTIYAFLILDAAVLLAFAIGTHATTDASAIGVGIVLGVVVGVPVALSFRPGAPIDAEYTDLADDRAVEVAVL